MLLLAAAAPPRCPPSTPPPEPPLYAPVCAAAANPSLPWLGRWLALGDLLELRLLHFLNCRGEHLLFLNCAVSYFFLSLI